MTQRVAEKEIISKFTIKNPINKFLFVGIHSVYVVAVFGILILEIININAA